MRDKMPTNVQWSYPLYVIRSEQRLLRKVDYEGFKCGQLFRHKELAELYKSQCEELGEDPLIVSEVATPEEFQATLIAFQRGGVDHAIWNPTVRPMGLRITLIDDLLACL